MRGKIFGVGFLVVLLTSFFLVQGETLNCQDCHEIDLTSSVHQDLDCQDCHTDIVDAEHEKKARKVDCGNCHEEYAIAMKQDLHHRLKERVGNAPPECVTCHGSHQIQAHSSIKKPAEAYCSDCHNNILPINPFHLTKTVSESSCLECHDTKDYKKELSVSVHAEFGCMDCHRFVVDNLEKHEHGIPFLQQADCYFCHKKEALQHKESIHGISLHAGVDEAAQCWNCHGAHKIVPVTAPESKVYFSNLADTCGACHDNPKLVKKYDIGVKIPSKMYKQSVHGTLTGKGDKAANCSLCHGVHNIKNLVQAGSTISIFNLPDTCGQCHKKIAADYKKSIHWIRAKKGQRDSPVCNDCHSEHLITAINGNRKKENKRNIQEKTCLRCHENPFITNRYNQETGQVKQYRDSYHGMAVRRGDADAALCMDCHGTHKILPKSHPESSVNPSNVTQTCQSCHPNASNVFSQSYSHKSATKLGELIIYWVKKIYLWLIIVVIGFMVLHNLLIYFFETQKSWKRQKGRVEIPRFTKNETLQHALLAGSFLMLVFSGFALKFPDFWLNQYVEWLGVTETIRQYVHRISGMIMILLGIYHLWYISFTGRGREVLRGFLPKLGDLREAFDYICYYFHLKEKAPESDQYDYTEKVEYIALLWGTLIMAFTGIILWFPTIFIRGGIPTWFFKLSEVIHYYEAILATLAIIVWHWFFVLFRPGVTSMCFSWIDGKMSLDDYKHHHLRHFKHILLEWKELKTEKKDYQTLQHTTKLFIEALEDAGLNPDNVFQAELDNDSELNEWIANQLSLSN